MSLNQKKKLQILQNSTMSDCKYVFTPIQAIWQMLKVVYSTRSFICRMTKLNRSHLLMGWFTFAFPSNPILIHDTYVQTADLPISNLSICVFQRNVHALQCKAYIQNWIHIIGTPSIYVVDFWICCNILKKCKLTTKAVWPHGWGEHTVSGFWFSNTFTSRNGSFFHL